MASPPSRPNSEPDDLGRAAAARLPDRFRPSLIRLEFRNIAEAGFQAAQQIPMKGALGRRQRIVNPQAVLAWPDQVRPAQISKVTRHPGLRAREGGYQVSHAHFSAAEQVKDAQPIPVRK